jgi:Ca2+-transporting ATPase
MDSDSVSEHGAPGTQPGQDLRAPWHRLTADSALEELHVGEDGLTPSEARDRQSVHGLNVIGEEARIRPLRILAHQFTGALVLVLAAAGMISLAIGHWEDAVVISIVLVLNATIGFAQEYRAERAIAALKGLVAPRCVVMRGGRRREVDSRELVPGDLVALDSGTRIPADLRLIRTTALSVDQSLLTGESVPVEKSATWTATASETPVAERRNMAFMGTSVASGRGRGVVVSIGVETELGAIAQDIRAVERPETPLQRRMERFGRGVAVAIVVLAGLTFALGLLRGESMSQMFLTAVAIAVSAVPEGLPVVMTITLAVASRRMARRNAFVRRLAAVETLGSCTVIATDKTGTLTENRMTVTSVWAGGESFAVGGGGLDTEGAILSRGEPATAELESPLYWTLLAGALCNEAELSTDEDGAVRPQGDPTEVALLIVAAKAGLVRKTEDAAYPQIDAVPFESQRGWAASVHRTDGDSVVLVKGAPERVMAMCDSVLVTGGEAGLEPEAIGVEAERMGAAGLRVLGMAVGRGESVAGSVLAGSPRGLVFAGLTGMMDPPRPEVSETVAACRRAGIRVLMVTGDHESTARSIARQVGIVHEDGATVVAGDRLAALTEDELIEALEVGRVFARVAPADKLRIVESLSRVGHVVAVTGDGVNDAPALKAAHVGAAMGKSGTDVAKEASDIVLADDRFATVAAAVEGGRTAFANLRNATFFLVSSGAGELLAILGSLLLRLPLPLLPAQLLWLNVVTNGVEDVALAVEPPDPARFRDPPRRMTEGILSRRLLERLVVTGLVMAAGTLWVFVGEWGGDPERLAAARVAALTTLVLYQVFHVGSCRSETRSAFAMSPFSNRFLFFGVGASLLLHVGAMYFPPTQVLLQLEPLGAETWLRMAAVATTVVIAVELHKRLRPPASRRGRGNAATRTARDPEPVMP